MRKRGQGLCGANAGARETSQPPGPEQPPKSEPELPPEPGQLHVDGALYAQAPPRPEEPPSRPVLPESPHAAPHREQALAPELEVPNS